MRNVENRTLISVTEAARRLGISPEAAFDLVVVRRELPIVYGDGHEGIPEEALEEYQRTHSQ